MHQHHSGGSAGSGGGSGQQQYQQQQQSRGDLSRWFHGEVGREETERRLKAQGGLGTFLVRYSHSTNKFVLSVLCDSASYHYPIDELPDGFYQVHGTSAKYLGIDLLVSEFRRTDNSIVCQLSRPVIAQPPPPAITVYGSTNALHLAARRANMAEVRRVLMQLQSGGACDPLMLNEKSSDNGATPLIEAAKTGSNDVVKLLLEAGAETGLRDCAGFTALHRAVQRSFAHVAETLLKLGRASPQVRCPFSGNTPLHEAAVLGHADCVNTLLRFHAAPHPRNCDGELPYELALRFGFAELAEAMANYRCPSPLTCLVDWFHSDLSKQDTEAALRRHRDPPDDGTFLLRRSSAGDRKLVLCVTCRGQTLKYAVEVSGGAYPGVPAQEAWFISGGPLHQSPAHLVEHLIRFADGIPCRLKWAVSPESKLIDVERLAPRGVERAERDIVRLDGAGGGGGGSNSRRSSTRRSGGSGGAASESSGGSGERAASGKSKSGGSGAGGSAAAAGGGGDLPLIPANQVILLARLGEGEFGEVFSGRLTRGDSAVQEVAVKVLASAQTRLDFVKEAAVMAKLAHPSIVRVLGLCENKRLMMLLELCPLGSLLDYIRQPARQAALTDCQEPLYRWALQVAEGMQYLEQRGCIHRDLAARNVLLADEGRAKISDFGLSRAVGADTDYYRATQRGKWPIKWYAPEAIYYRLFSSASDVWSFGVCLWELYSLGEPPWGDLDGVEVLKQIEEGCRLPQPQLAASDLYNLMQQCWAYKPEDRPSFDRLQAWFQHVTTNVYENLPPE
ncbi:hypothetical protein BOX15_Mlig008106g2 [Macrostomum lignano]|uniref:Tyrosine-protein kinase n=1 Tax=Macrostomum lignano TaxID=282301 RepID=A0A267GU35_9PLAT|nr:hypothetical protein BOX15_Mlig008106g2 [Macrostomum lignano]